MVKRGLNKNAIIIEDAQTEIKVRLIETYLSGGTLQAGQLITDRIIKEAVEKLTNKELQRDAVKSLRRFAFEIWKKLLMMLGHDGLKVKKTISYATGQTKKPPTEIAELRRQGNFIAQQEYVEYTTTDKGVPLGIYNKEYMKQVDECMRQIAKDNALDPVDITNRNSLSNKAEMLLRQDYHRDQIESLREQGVKLVVVSVHADCSDRCAKYQGKIYSLDHTSGRTEDGRTYEPLENATDNPVDRYTAKSSGRTYQNGLFGFNCRHSLHVYEVGMDIPHVTKAEQKREYKINNRQREMERQIRYHKEMALMEKAAGHRKEADKEREMAIRIDNAYKKFSRKNERAYYPDRTRVLSLDANRPKAGSK